MIVAILAGLSVKALSLSQDSVTQLVTADDTLKAFEKIVRKPHSPHKATIMAISAKNDCHKVWLLEWRLYVMYKQ